MYHWSMLFRLWHFLYRHNWKERDIIFFHGTGQMEYMADTDSARYRIYGFTDITLTCDCGARKVHRLVGMHGKDSGDREVDALRKMAGLK